MSIRILARTRLSFVAQSGARLKIVPPALVQQSRYIRIFPGPPPFENVQIPEKHRLPVYPKVPSFHSVNAVKPTKAGKELYRIFGEESVHNRFLLGQFGIVAISGGTMKQVHFEVLRMRMTKMLIPNKSFAIYRVDPPFKPVSSHGVGKKLGGGKGPIDHYVTPVKAGRVIVEVAGRVLWEEVQPWLQALASKMPFEAMAMSQDMMTRLDAEERRLEQTDENPYTFEWLVRNNMFDCHRHVSPRDRMWFGRFIYRDRTLNKKWNNVLQSKYDHR